MGFRFGDRRGERGFLAITFALMIFGLLAFAGLAVDVGYLEWHKRRLQGAADAAAMGALRELERGSIMTLVNAGRNDANLNGFAHGVDNTTVTINNPPVYGSLAGNNGAVEAVIQRSVNTYFMQLFGKTTVPISARAVARTALTQPGLGGCVYALNKSLRASLNIQGSTSVSFDCNAIVESSDSKAFKMGGSETLWMAHNANVRIVGGFELAGQTYVKDKTTGQSLTPVTGIADPGDPFKDVPAPTAAGLTLRSATGVSYDMNSPPPGNKLSPGIYCNGIDIRNTNGVTYIMEPGLYYIAGGGLRWNSLARVSGVGVTIYNTAGSTALGCSSNYAFKGITLDGQAVVTLKAPTGPENGGIVAMAIFEDRNAPQASSNETKIVGGATTTIDGAVYIRNNALKFSGNNSTNGYLILVADNIQINGNSVLNNNYSGLSQPNPITPAATGGGLAE